MGCGGKLVASSNAEKRLPMLNILYYLRRSAFISVLMVSILQTAIFAGGIDEIQLLKISAQDERAVVKTPDGKTRLVKPGDSLGAAAKIVEISTDRLVIEENNGQEAETVIIRLVDGKQKVERMKKVGEKQPMMLAPTSITDAKKQEQQGSIY